MKKCPRCDRTYSESETFCEDDGNALIGADPAFVGSSGGGNATECPVCGGKAEPGEIICNFCGARLSPETPAPAPPPQQNQGFGQRQTSVPDEPPADVPQRFTGQMPEQDVEEESGGGYLRTAGYIVAALIALIGGAWFAIQLTHRQAAKEEAKASPSAMASPIVPSGPAVALANNIPIQVTGVSASAPERSNDQVRKVFDDGKATLLDAYNRALAGDSTMADGMLVKLKIMPDGSVGGAAVVTSTAPNPGLDAEVVRDVSGWSFTPFGGSPVETVYPMVFSHSAEEQASIEAALNAKVASLSPNEAPEYASAPAPAVAPSEASTPQAAAAASPEAAPPSVAPPAAVRPRPPRREVAAVPKPRPTPPLRETVEQALRSNRALSRVQFYTNSGGVVTLFGQVFDDKAKTVAENTVRVVPGVTSVIDTLTTDTAQWQQQQVQIQQQLANAGLDRVTVKVIGKAAFLDGEVKTEQEKDRAVTVTEGAAPVTVRTNLIRVETGKVFGF